MIVRGVAARATEEPAGEQAERDDVGEGPELYLVALHVKKEPDEGAEESTGRGKPLPDADQREGIGGHLLRLVGHQREEVGHDEAAHQQPGDGRAQVQLIDAAFLGAPQRHPGTQQDAQRHQDAEGMHLQPAPLDDRVVTPVRNQARSSPRTPPRTGVLPRPDAAWPPDARRPEAWTAGVASGGPAHWGVDERRPPAGPDPPSPSSSVATSPTASPEAAPGPRRPVGALCLVAAAASAGTWLLSILIPVILRGRSACMSVRGAGR